MGPVHQLNVETNTTCTEIAATGGLGFTVYTTRGEIMTKHVVHCTNGHVATLVPGLQGKIIPVRGQMTAQTPTDSYIMPVRSSLDESAGFGTSPRSWTFYHARGIDYMTHRLARRDDGYNPKGVLLLGGGLALAGQDGLAEFGVSDDGAESTGGPNYIVSAYLGGLLRYMFRDPRPPSPHSFLLYNDADGAEETSPGRVHAHWTGIMGFSADTLPFVGPLSTSITGRKPRSLDMGAQEWVAAGFTGNGMVNAWGSGVALGCMIRERLDLDNETLQRHLSKQAELGEVVTPEVSPALTIEEGLVPARWKEWFPKEYMVSNERLRKADAKTLLDLLDD